MSNAKQGQSSLNMFYGKLTALFILESLRRRLHWCKRSKSFNSSCRSVFSISNWYWLISCLNIVETLTNLCHFRLCQHSSNDVHLFSDAKIHEHLDNQLWKSLQESAARNKLKKSFSQLCSLQRRPNERTNILYIVLSVINQYGGQKVNDYSLWNYAYSCTNRESQWRYGKFCIPRQRSFKNLGFMKWSLFIGLLDCSIAVTILTYVGDFNISNISVCIKLKLQ